MPSGATGQVATLAAPHLGSDAAWVSATKGLEPVTCRRMTEVVSDVTRGAVKVAVLSGPSFAREVADGQHTAVVVACEDLEVARRVRTILSGPSFSAHASTDVIGVELGGALKNIVAIAAGMLVGLGHGHDAVAALITHGLRETTALCVALGARPETMTGLAGLGDLVLTCTGSASRNRRLGEMLARGSSLDEARRELGQVSEGVATTERALVEARTHGVDVPITLAVYEVLFDGRPPREAIEALLERHLGEEPS